MKKICILIGASLLISCGNGNGNSNNDEEQLKTIEDLFPTEEPTVQEVEEDSFEVKPFVLLSETVSDDGKKTQFIVQIPEKYTDMDLHIMLSRLKQKCKKTDDFDVSFFIKGTKLDASPYAIGYVEGQTYSVDLTSTLNAKKANNNIKRDFVGKWPIGSQNEIMTIYKHNGKYYLEYQIKGEFTGKRYEMIRSKSPNNVYRFKNYDDGDETYEVVESGMYAIEENGAKMFFPSAK